MQLRSDYFHINSEIYIVYLVPEKGVKWDEWRIWHVTIWINKLT